MTEEIVYLRLLNGEQLIGKLVDETIEDLLVEDIMSIEMTWKPSGSSVSLVRWLPFTEETMHPITKVNIITKSSVRETVIDYYKYCNELYHKHIEDMLSEDVNYSQHKLDMVEKEEKIAPHDEMETARRLLAFSNTTIH